MTPASLEEIITAPGMLRTLFQPIVRMCATGLALVALECLTRGPEDTPYTDAATLFSEAAAQGFELEIDRAAVATALETAAAHAVTHDLFINVNPTTLAADADFPAYVAELAAAHGIACERITIEITEHGRDGDPRGLLPAVRGLRSLGIRVALDDFGAGKADHRALWLCPPNWVKLDGRLFRGARLWPAARCVAEAAVQHARRWGIGIVAEGMEHPRDVEVARELGIDVVQGYWLCRPLAAEQAAHAGDFIRAK